MVVLGGIARRLALVVFGVGLGAVMIEAALQAISVAVRRDVLPAPAADDHWVVLCVGDSHTWGAGRGYPGYLATALAARSPRFRVVNLGVPGSNTAQLRRRFPEYLDRFRPRAVVMWSGLNNSWNRTDSDLWAADGEPPDPWFTRLWHASRLVRFVRLWRRQSALRAALDESATLVAPEMFKHDDDPRNTFRRRLGDDEDLTQHAGAPDLSVDEAERVTTLDVTWLTRQAAERGIPMVVITYSLTGGIFDPANRGIERGAAATRTPVVRARDMIPRVEARFEGRPVPPLYDASVHPTQLLYDEVGRGVLEVLDTRGALPRE